MKKNIVFLGCLAITSGLLGGCANANGLMEANAKTDIVGTWWLDHATAPELGKDPEEAKTVNLSYDEVQEGFIGKNRPMLILLSDRTGTINLIENVCEGKDFSTVKCSSKPVQAKLTYSDKNMTIQLDNEKKSVEFNKIDNNLVLNYGAMKIYLVKK